jgi:hypothetical protein
MLDFGGLIVLWEWTLSNRLLCNELMRLLLDQQLFVFVTVPPTTAPNGETQPVAGTNNESERTLVDSIALATRGEGLTSSVQSKLSNATAQSASKLIMLYLAIPTV